MRKQLGDLMVAHRSEDNQWRGLMSAARAVGPAVLVNKRGKGVVACVAASPDAAWAGNYRMPEHRHLIRNLVRLLNPAPEVEVQAPLNTEIVVTRDRNRGRTLVHLITFNSPPTGAAAAFPQGRRVLPPVMEEPASYTAVVRVNRPFGRAERATASGVAIGGVRVTGNTIEAPITNIHEVLAIY